MTSGFRASKASRIVTSLLFLFVFASLAALSGCRAGEAKSTGFATADLMKHDANQPFHKSWRKEGFDYRQYKKLYVANVNTEYMLKQTDWQKGERKDDIEKDVKELATYAKQAIEKAFREDKNHLFQVIDAPDGQSDTLILEMAITEVVPSKVLLNALGYAPFGVGLTITAVRMFAQDLSSAAMELRVRVASSREVIAMAADREAEQFAPVSVRGLTWYSHAKMIIDLWSKKFVEVANAKPGEKVKQIDTVTLQPW